MDIALLRPTFKPALRQIYDITPVGNNSLITTTFDHSYAVGLILRLIVPREYGMIQVNKRLGEILEVPNADTFIINIDTRSFDTFIIPNNPLQYAQTIPVGESDYKLNSAVRNVLPYT